MNLDSPRLIVILARSSRNKTRCLRVLRNTDIEMDHEGLQALVLSLKLGVITTLCLLGICLPMAWCLSRWKSSWKIVVDALVGLPLVLPPTVIGFYLLIAMADGGVIGTMTAFMGLESLAFSFGGLVLGSVVYSLPFVMQPLQRSFEQIDTRLLEFCYVAGKTPLQTFYKVILPTCQKAVISAGVLGFAHTLGEFGVVLMIGGNIPDKTRVASIAIFDLVESLQYSQAAILAAILLFISFIAMLVVSWAGR
jgi:molybdate transport system permease protein